MPVRLLNSSVLAWPDRATVDAAVRAWILVEGPKHMRLLGVAYFGSYSRGDWGVGSDLDLVAVVEASTESFDRRPLGWDLSPLPVPADLLVYTQAEWNCLMKEDSLFARTLKREAVWFCGAEPHNAEKP